MKTKKGAGATVSININTNEDESTSSEDNASASTDSATESGSTSDSSSSSTESSEELPGEQQMGREDLLDQLEEMQEELEGMWGEAKALEESLMPSPQYCSYIVDVIVAWNDALAVMLRDARPRCEEENEQTNSDNSTEEEDASEDREPNEGLFMLNLDTDPQTLSDLNGDYQVAKTKCAAYGDECKDQLESLTTSHDMLLECQHAELKLAKKKIDDDVEAINHGTQELSVILEQTLSEQRVEQKDMMTMVRDFRGKAPAIRLPEHSNYVYDVVVRLPSSIKKKRGWELQLQRKGGASARELLNMLQTIIELLTPLPKETWDALTTDVEAKVAAGKTPDDINSTLSKLEANVVALKAPPDLLPMAKELLGSVTMEAAQRSQTRADIENNVCIALRQFARAIQEKYDEFCSTQTRMAETMTDLLHRTQAQWHAKMTQLQNECTHPLQDMGVPFAKSAMGARCLVEYNKLLVIVKKDLELQRRSRVAELVKYAMEQVPFLQDLQRQLTGFVPQLLTAKSGFLEDC